MVSSSRSTSTQDLRRNVLDVELMPATAATDEKERFLYGGGIYYNRIATLADGEFLGTGLKNGSITADGTSLYCITPRANVDEKIVTQVCGPTV